VNTWTANKPPTVLLVVDQLGVGGLERQMVELLKGLQQNGRFRTALAVLDHGGELEGEAARYAGNFLSLRRRARYDVTPALGLLREVQRLRVEVIHAVGWMSNLAALATARLRRLPLINGGIRAAPPRLSLKDRLIRWTALGADLIVANSGAGLAAYGLDWSARSRVIPNGLDWRRFAGITPVVNGRFGICMVANFSPYKDQATVIRALPLILQAFPEARLTLVGLDKGTLPQTRRLVSALGLERTVRIVEGTSNPEAFIAGSRVCTLLSPLGESLSNALLEYLALGKPVVASYCPGNAAVIRSGKTGLLLMEPSPESLAASIIRLFREPREAKVMGEAGRRLVKERYLLEHMVRQYEALYDELLNRRGF
jgi:glycosyltransferase involved in cell wall biosynthesis